jgi:pullulanase
MRTGEEVRRFLQFLEVPKGVIGFALGPHAGGDSFETILVFFNSNREEVEVAVDAGCWEVLTSDQGVGHLSIVTGPKVVLPALSPLILARGVDPR